METAARRHRGGAGDRAGKRGNARARLAGADPVAAYRRSCENITGPIARAISADGLRGVRDALSAEGREVFDRAYAAGYRPARFGRRDGVAVSGSSGQSCFG